MSAQPQSPPPESDHQDPASENAEEIDNPALDLLSLSRAVKARKAEYTRRRNIRVKIGTWNVAAISGTEKDIGKWFVEGAGVCEKLSGVKKPKSPESQSADGESSTSQPDLDDQQNSGESATPLESSPEEIDLYVLGLQEIVDVSSPAEALRPYVDPAPSNRWKEAIHKALPPGYQLVAETQLIGLLLLIYASPAIGENVSSISSNAIGTGLMGYMGNKGGVVTRIVLGETTRLVFVNCHLAAGSDKGSLERRNWDASQIVSRARFGGVDSERGPQHDSTEGIGQEDFTFWFGDLNYRLDDIPGDDVRQVLARHTVNAYDTARQAQQKSGNHQDHHSQPSDQKPPSPKIPDERTDPVTDEEIDPRNDPASLQTAISSLLAHDQLLIQQRKGTVFHKGWREGEISFLPTYKYDIGSVAMFDSSEKHRGPSWCDRILFRTRRDMMKHEQLDREAELARKRDEEMHRRGLDKAVADDNVLFDYDPDVDGANSADEYVSDEEQADDAASLESQDASQDLIHLDHYVSHQGILSSDHKPLDAVFTLTFDAVNPHLKAKVHQEVVRELDKAENEARPGLTVVVDTHGDENQDTKDPNAVDFGNVAFDVPVHRSLTIANTSGASATFSFAERPSMVDESNPETPSWIDIKIDRPSENPAKDQASGLSSARHTLLPGEVANVDITAHVHDIQHVRLLNLKKVKLEEIMVLHVDSGRDHFISLTGHWLPTCFGCSVDELTRMPEAGARSMASAEGPGPAKGETEVRLSAPRELFRLTESISELTERAVAEWSMTKGDAEEDQAPWTKDPNGAAWPFQPDTWIFPNSHERAPLLAMVRESLDTNESLTSVFAPEIPSFLRLEILCETLLTFLNSLSDGIVTASVWQNMEQQMIARERAKYPPRSWEETQAWVLESLAYSPAHSVSFTFVTFMLARIANEVAPVPSSTGGAPSKNSKEGGSSKEQSADPKQSQESNSIGDRPKSHRPTPASAAAFIAAGSFRRKNRSPTSSTGSDASTSTSQTTSPTVARRQAVEAAFAAIFARVLISPAAPTPAKEKERRASDERRRGIIEPFLKMIGVDDRGPSGGRA
ncbi:hypothetical protein NUU61_002178 [Penicillium alfredii]|uniref:Inositol polyphosphate-related phosphatase domain-containing protein n=1 Tax=Penicillium alfredii TaxID=1506179 RepID=A0A9W9FR18_9EURO|nr:uncharacterized protein NUU61_002178 [Penicillium alfredii]KAJ5104831.1 hypothetical protein NUU61_002178 [Penicillium alfredii]